MMTDQLLRIIVELFSNRYFLVFLLIGSLSIDLYMLYRSIPINIISSYTLVALVGYRLGYISRIDRDESTGL